MFYLLRGVIKYSFYASALSAGAGGAFMYKTKPSDKSLYDHLSRTKMTRIKWLDEKVIDLLDPEFKDYVIFKTATFSVGKNEIVFIGVCHEWFEANKNNYEYTTDSVSITIGPSTATTTYKTGKSESSITITTKAE